MTEIRKADVIAEAKRVAELATAKRRPLDSSKAGVRGWLIRAVRDQPYQSGELYVDRIGNDWKDFHNKLGQIWLREDGTLLYADEAYGESAELGRFNNSWSRTATNEDLIGEGNLDYEQIMRELRRLALIVE
jgi:hypothetical protein